MITVSVVCAVVALVLGVVSACCFRISGWHRDEADYWSDVHLRVLFDPSLESRYLPVLEWARANRPSVWVRLRRWQSPEVRRAAAEGLRP